MSEAEWAWAAGLFEGEGCIIRTPSGVKMNVSMCDEDVIRRWGQIVGYGHFQGPYIRKDGTKPQYCWQVSSYRQVEELFERFRPWLGERRKQRFIDVLGSMKRPKERLPASPECGFYLQVIPCTRGYMRHRYRKEGACRTCQDSRNLYQTQKRKQRLSELE